jgi:uncharacterized membrane protein
MHSIHHWFETLSGAGICDMPQTDKCENETPWYISVLMGFCGWLASLFLLGFLGLAFAELLESGIVSTFLGLALLGCAFSLQKQENSEFLSQFSLAISVAGQGLLAISVFLHLEFDMQVQWFVFALIKMSVAFLMPNRINRFMSALFAVICTSIALHESGIASLFTPLMMLLVAHLWLNEFTLSTKLAATRAIIYGLTIGLVITKVSIGYFNFDENNEFAIASGVSIWLEESLSIAVLLFVLQQLYTKQNLKIKSKVAVTHIFLLITVCVLTFYANGLALSLMLLLLAFASRNHFLLALGVAAGLFNLSAYYYWLDISLFNKSLVLMGVGAACLILFYVSKKQASSPTYDKGESHV